MAVPALKYAIGNSSSTTLSSSVTNTDTSMAITSDTNFAAKSGAGMVIVDEGESTEELAYSASKTGSTLSTPLVNRGLEGGSAQAHASGATIKGILTSDMWNDVIDALTNVVDATTGSLDTTKVVDLTTAQTLTNKVLTAPTITGATITGSTLTTATITKPALNGTNPTGATYTPATGSQTVALDCTSNNIHIVTGHASGTAITFTITGVTNNQPFIVSILQGAVVSTIAGWFATIRWAGGSAPTLTATINKRDTFGFIRTGTNTYDGFIVGQNC